MKEEKTSLQNEDSSDQSTEDVIEESEPDKARPLDRWLQNFEHRPKKDPKQSPRKSKQDRVRPLFLVWPSSWSFCWECFRLPSM